MNVLEMKGSLYDLISKIEDVTLLEKIYRVTAVLLDEDDFWNELGELEKQELLSAIKLAESDENLVSNAHAQKKLTKWRVN